MPDYDAASIDEIADTWRWRQDGASWIASGSRPSGTTVATNEWMARTVDDVLADLAALARVRNAILLANERTELTRRPEEPNSRFREQLLEAISHNRRPLTFVRLGVDVRVWVRTTDSPDHPRVARLSYPGIELGVHLDDSGWVEFSLDNTLLSGFTYPVLDPNPLHPLNQPLLEGALRALSARFHTALERYGELPGTVELGFSSDGDDY